MQTIPIVYLLKPPFFFTKAKLCHQNSVAQSRSNEGSKHCSLLSYCDTLMFVVLFTGSPWLTTAFETRIAVVNWHSRKAWHHSFLATTAILAFLVAVVTQITVGCLATTLYNCHLQSPASFPTDVAFQKLAKEVINGNHGTLQCHDCKPGARGSDYDHMTSVMLQWLEFQVLVISITHLFSTVATSDGCWTIDH